MSGGRTPSREALQKCQRRESIDPASSNPPYNSIMPKKKQYKCLCEASHTFVPYLISSSTLRYKSFIASLSLEIAEPYGIPRKVEIV
jgi:hypothetical protein